MPHGYAPGGMLTLGDLIKELATHKIDEQVCYSQKWPVLMPTSLNSYRGYYEDLALGYTTEGWIVVGDLLAKLRAAVGVTFTGYKGGYYRMDEKTSGLGCEVWRNRRAWDRQGG